MESGRLEAAVSPRRSLAPTRPEGGALEDVVRRVVREELRGMLGRLLADEPAEYSSRRGHGPPGYAAREWRALAKRIGTRRGRWYVVTRAQLEALEATRRAPAESTAPAPANDATSAWTPAAALESVGLRRTR